MVTGLARDVAGRVGDIASRLPTSLGQTSLSRIAGGLGLVCLRQTFVRRCQKGLRELYREQASALVIATPPGSGVDFCGGQATSSSAAPLLLARDLLGRDLHHRLYDRHRHS